MRRCRLRLGASVLVLALGCGGDSNLAPVSGIVLLDGKPVEKLSVTFFPAQGRAANGVTLPDGRFELTTFKSGDGALIGEHTVTIAVMLDPPTAMTPEAFAAAKRNAAKAPPIPAKYQDAGTTDLKRTVEADGDNEFKFELSSK